MTDKETRETLAFVEEMYGHGSSGSMKDAALESAELTIRWQADRIKKLEAALRYVCSGRKHPTCPTCTDLLEVARAALEESE
jgi:hypothetical protein